MSASRGAPIPLEGWQGSTGISGSFQSESVATFAWHRWQGSIGISGNLRAEYAPMMGFFAQAVPYTNQTRLFDAVGRWCVTQPWRVLLLYGLLTVGTLPLVTHLSVETDVRNMLPGEL